MTIEELYEMRDELLANKKKFSELNTKYNLLLKKLNSKGAKKKKVTEKKFIKGLGLILFWLRFFLLALVTSIFNISGDVILALLLGNLFLKIFDEMLILPKIWKVYGEKIKKRYEGNQSELYEEVYQARRLYHELYNKYLGEIEKLSLEEQMCYKEYLESLDLPWELEESKGSSNFVGSFYDVKMLKMANEEDGIYE